MAATRARRGARRGGGAGVGLGHRPAAGAVALGGAQPDSGGHAARERLRRPADAVVAVHRQPLRQRPLPGRVTSSSPSSPCWCSSASASASPAGARSVAGRALVTMWVVTLVMSFGRTTFGSLYKILPGSSDIFIRRFQMGVQLSGILLAGIALVFLGQLVLRGVLDLFPEDRRGWARQPAGRGIVAGLCIVALVAGALPGLERPRHLRRPQRDQHRPAGRGRRGTGAAGRPPAGLRARPPQGPRLRRRADQLGQRLHGRRGAGLQVPGEQGHRRGRLHVAHGLAHDRPRVLLRREQPGRLPALRHRLHDPALGHDGAGAKPTRSAARGSTACGRSPTAATSTCTTPPAR